jgi:hypothetical protein
MFFLDESGTPPKGLPCKDRYFVIGGLVIPDGAWHKLRDAVQGMKIRRKLRGELKWRYFSGSNNDDKNPMRLFSQEQRNEIRSELYGIICAIKSIKAMACVSCIEAAFAMPTCCSSDELYHYTYKPMSERFQYHLQDLTRAIGRMETGIIVADPRGAVADQRFRGAHELLIKRAGDFTSNYAHLIESLFFQPSDLSLGVQLADMVAGAVWRKYEKGDETFYRQIETAFRTSPKGVIDGYGIVKFPKRGWK